MRVQGPSGGVSGAQQDIDLAPTGTSEKAPQNRRNSKGVRSATSPKVHKSGIDSPAGAMFPSRSSRDRDHSEGSRLGIGINHSPHTLQIHLCVCTVHLSS